MYRYDQSRAQLIELPPSVSPSQFTARYLYEQTIKGITEKSTVGRKCGQIIIKLPTTNLLHVYSKWSAAALRRICSEHGIQVRTRTNLHECTYLLRNHTCSVVCREIAYVFRDREPRYARRNMRTNQPESRRSESPPPLETHATPPILEYEHLTPPSLSIKREIIAEWADNVKKASGDVYACAVCAKKANINELHSIHASKIDLTILRNDSIPPAALPTTYNLSAYDGAILCPIGILDLHRKGDLCICAPCLRSLTGLKTIPKFALANYLYYGHHALPSDIRESFQNASIYELLLIARARANKISFKFSDCVDGTQGIGHPATSQRYIKGNVLVLPQHSTKLRNMLPPSTNELIDTVCAIFVGHTRPNAKTIHKLQPVLVRKSRVKQLITFLIENNPFYMVSPDFGGLNQQNLDELFEDKQENDVGIPCSLNISFIEMNDTIASSDADYTGRSNVQCGPTNAGEVVMENVGYTWGDYSTKSCRDMKIDALKHCLSGGRYVESQLGNTPIPDFDSASLMSMVFPHLDPWGIGGFAHPGRTTTISFEEHVRHVLQTWNSPFAADHAFAFVCYNIIQKKKVSDSMRFQVSTERCETIIKELLSINPTRLHKLTKHYQQNPYYVPTDERDRQILRILHDINLVGYDIPGTVAHKIAMRNQIRGLIINKGTPTLFITLNPADVHHPLVRKFAETDEEILSNTQCEPLSEWDRRVLAAKNPGACARFFHFMITNIISTIMRFGRKERGLLGKCLAYYGVVETQGRGTLHCHMLVWLEGHPAPGILKNLLETSTEYRAKLTRWIEDTIHCEPMEYDVDDQHAFGPPPTDSTQRTDMEPNDFANVDILTDTLQLSDTDFIPLYTSRVNSLIAKHNWHIHTTTCWKNLRPGEPKIDANCRMRIDGTTREKTSISDEGIITSIRRRHPWIVNYNDLIVFLMQCNMDTKFIGSGEDAKALVYYFTDYITKPPLSMHAGLTALCHAVNRSEAIMNNRDRDIQKLQAKALTATVNGLLSKQEISHPLVMAYLIGGSDNYASDTFRVLHWASFNRHFIRHQGGYKVEPGHVCEELHNTELDPASDDDTSRNTNEDISEDAEVGNDEQTLDDANEDSMILMLGPGTISATNQQLDYIFRPSDPEFEELCLYDYVSLAERVTAQKESERPTYNPGATRRGRRPGLRGSFRKGHPQAETHLVRLRFDKLVPIILGPSTPHSNRSNRDRNLWARMMCILFVPWRTPNDLYYNGEQWVDALDRHRSRMANTIINLITNITTLAECRNARRRGPRHRTNVRENATNNDESNAECPTEHHISHDKPIRLSTVDDVFDTFDESQVSMHEGGSSAMERILSQRIGDVARGVLDYCFMGEDTNNDATATNVDMHASAVKAADLTRIEREQQLMRLVKKERPIQPQAVQDEITTGPDMPNIRQPNVRYNTLSQNNGWQSNQRLYGHQVITTANDIAQEMNLTGNPEQLRAFNIVANHAGHKTAQLLMYVAGVGGTGKSHVIQAIKMLFQRIGRGDELTVGAPTGAAATLIGGYTIHALTMLPDPSRKKDCSRLQAYWRPIQYFIIDEISMVGCELLTQISLRLHQAKGGDEVAGEQIFGGVNMIFLGDFGQLKPVRQVSLFSHKMTNDPGIQQSSDKHGIKHMTGSLLWRQVNTVVKLRRNQRQADDPLYAAMLGSIREGRGLKDTNLQSVLRSRIFQTLYMTNRNVIRDFADAPVIVGKKSVRDSINARIIQHKARTLHQPIHIYHSKDVVEDEMDSEELRNAVWQLSSSVTDDSIGKLPIFVGMKVMVIENLAFKHKVVNGAEGHVIGIKYDADSIQRRYARVVYVKIPGAGKIDATAEEPDIVPIFPSTNSFTSTVLIGGTSVRIKVSRQQLPILPAYSYTDYKSQGRSLRFAIVDIHTAKSIQGVYVMLSRVRTLSGLAILRPFHKDRLIACLSQELRREMARIDILDAATREQYETPSDEAMITG